MSDASRSLEKRDLFILCDGPIELVKVNQEMGFNKLHFNGMIEYGDDFHTMSELYEHRMALTVALLNTLSKESNPNYNQTFKSKLHKDGTMFEGYFICGITNGMGKTWITYHYDFKYWNLFKIPEYEHAPEYDGHTSKDVIERLLKL